MKVTIRIEAGPTVIEHTVDDHRSDNFNPPYYVRTARALAAEAEAVAFRALRGAHGDIDEQV